LFEEDLSFRYYINNLEKKIARSVGMLAKVKPFLNSKVLLQYIKQSFTLI